MVSIITPTYNCGRFIAETIRSVQAQTYQDWEMIIVDDCSTDNTASVVMPFVENDQRIRYIVNERNLGAALTRNRALREAQGEYIAFLDSDDLWLPEKLEHQLAFMERNDYAFTYHEYDEIDEQSQPLGVKVSGPRHVTRCGMFNYCWPGCLTVMYRASVVGMLQIPDIRKNNDYSMWLQAIKKTDCYLMPEMMARYRKRTGSISNSGYVHLVKWHYRMFRQVEHQSPVLSTLNTVRNLFFGCIKKLFYVKKIKQIYGFEMDF